MKSPHITGRLFAWCLMLLGFALSAHASVTVDPKFIFLDASHHSVTVTVTNSGEEDAEVWVDVRYGYETSDDSGKIKIYVDSLATGEPSAAQWIRSFPQRFVVGPGESQTVRIAVRPPAGVPEGEYWARIFFTSKPRNVSRTPLSSSATSTRPGLNLLTSLSLPFHYRLGRLSTGLEVGTITPVVTDTAILVPMQLTRTGNASFWGTRTVTVKDQSGKTVATVTKNLSVYKKMTLIDKINRVGLAPGTYSIDVEFVTGKRSDIRTNSLTQAAPMHAAASVLVP